MKGMIDSMMNKWGTVVPTAGAVNDSRSFETPEMKELFGQWIKDLKNRILTVVEEKRDPGEIAAALGMPESTLLEIIITMAREGSIRITGIKAKQ